MWVDCVGGSNVRGVYRDAIVTLDDEGSVDSLQVCRHVCRAVFVEWVGVECRGRVCRGTIRKK